MILTQNDIISAVSSSYSFQRVLYTAFQKFSICRPLYLWFVVRRAAECRQKQIMEYFESLDVARQGYLSVDQLIGPIMHMTGIDEPGARQFIKTLDSNDDGHIDKNEFMDMWTVMFE